MQLLEFKYGKYKIMYPENYYQFLKEVYVLDVYRSNLIQQDYIVLDLGANIGDFSVLASHKVGPRGRVISIEPNKEDFDLLKLNLERNKCSNVTPINVGVGSKDDEREITFWGKTFKCKIMTLANVLSSAGLTSNVDFIKMDIEGFEVDVVNQGIDIVKNSKVISVECHGTKKKLDSILSQYGFKFKPINYRYYYKKMIKTMLLHPNHFIKAAQDILSKNPRVLSNTVLCKGTSQEEIVSGSYVKTI
jgi:FkbM family methyltransferase